MYIFIPFIQLNFYSPFHKYIYINIYSSIRLSIHPLNIYSSTHSSIHLPLHISIYSSTHASIYQINIYSVVIDVFYPSPLSFRWQDTVNCLLELRFPDVRVDSPAKHSNLSFIYLGKILLDIRTKPTPKILKIIVLLIYIAAMLGPLVCPSRGA